MSEYGIDTYIGSMEYYELAPGLKICRILNGMWQVAGGHGPIDSKVAIEEMVKYHNAGFTTWDLADIYGPAEDLDRKSTRLNSSHANISYAVFCLKKKKK